MGNSLQNGNNQFLIDYIDLKVPSVKVFNLSAYLDDLPRNQIEYSLHLIMLIWKVSTHESMLL